MVANVPMAPTASATATHPTISARFDTCPKNVANEQNASYSFEKTVGCFFAARVFLLRVAERVAFVRDGDDFLAAGFEARGVALFVAGFFFAVDALRAAGFVEAERVALLPVCFLVEAGDFFGVLD